MYYGGVGVVKNIERAKELFKQAAEKDEHAKGILEMLEAEEKNDKR